MSSGTLKGKVKIKRAFTMQNIHIEVFSIFIYYDSRLSGRARTLKFITIYTYIFIFIYAFIKYLTDYLSHCFELLVHIPAPILENLQVQDKCLRKTN